MLVLLDLSAAFDTIDREILFKPIEKKCGIKGNVLNFLKLYLTDRKQKVVIGDDESRVVMILVSISVIMFLSDNCKIYQVLGIF